MSPLDSFILIACSVGVLWGLWLLLQFVFDAIDDFWWAFRNANLDEAETEDSVKLTSGAESSDSRW